MTPYDMAVHNVKFLLQFEIHTCANANDRPVSSQQQIIVKSMPGERKQNGRNMREKGRKTKENARNMKENNNTIPLLFYSFTLLFLLPYYALTLGFLSYIGSFLNKLPQVA